MGLSNESKEIVMNILSNDRRTLMLCKTTPQHILKEVFYFHSSIIYQETEILNPDTRMAMDTSMRTYPYTLHDIIKKMDSEQIQTVITIIDSYIDNGYLPVVELN